MSSCFAFRCKEADASARPSLVIFFSGNLSTDSIAKQIKRDIQRNLLPCRVRVIAAATQREALMDLRKNKSLQDEFESLIGDPDKKMKVQHYDSTGKLIDSDTGKSIGDAERDRILHAGMIDIFERRKGLVESPANHHFMMPSGLHVDRFIRASNLLITGHEVSFLALALLDRLPSTLKHIYVDTSSISYLVCTAVLMRGLPLDRPPLVESFESYSAVRRPFDFVEGADSLVIVSATSSGSLVKHLKDSTNFSANQLITLFHFGLPDGQIGLFDVSELPVQPIFAKPGDCELCRNGSRLVRIVEDQFLPETPTAEAVLIKKSDFIRQEFFKEFLNTGVLSWSVQSNRQDDSTEHFYIDVATALHKRPSRSKHAMPAGRSLAETLEKVINKHFSHHIDHVIRLDDDGSKSLCEQIKKLVRSGRRKINWSTLSEVDGLALKDRGSAVVVAGVITSGRKLLEASRKLRHLSASSSIVYIVGFSKIPTESDLTQLRKDLEMGGHSLVILKKCPMPRVSARDSTAWHSEDLKLRKCTDPLEESANLPDLFAQRLGQLTALMKGQIDARSAANQLFLPTPRGAPLKLRPRFAFWPDMSPDSSVATQAEVYWTICAILHDMRSRDSGLASTYHTRVIDPVCFDRYNDGVIQASLLRAATPTELNYAVDASFSRRITDIIISAINERDNEQGEAALEFMLALWTGRLKVAEIHLPEIEKACTSTTPELAFLAKRLEKKPTS